jgi:hypothetical protein
MKNRSILSLSSLAVILVAMFALACKKKFDEPATVIDPGVTANKTIKDFKTQYPVNSGEFRQITDDVILRGIVVGNDKTGNIYKQLFVQDSTGGIMLEVNALGLYNTFPVGREVFIMTKGLYVANETGMVKLCTREIVSGTPTVSGIPATLVDKYLVRGSINNPVVPKVVTLSQLNSDYISTLVQLVGYEVATADLNKTYADTSANKATTNINLSNCGGQSIIMRTSGYANFAGAKLPQGNGTVTAIYTVFNTTKQLVVRDSSDLQMKNPRCGSGVSTSLVYKTIQEIRALGAGAIIPANTGIRGTIVSSTFNEATGNYRIQDGSGYGIQLRFPANNPNYGLNDSVKVDVSNLSVDLFNGEMQITNIGNSEKIGTGTVTPRVTTAAAIAANLNTWSSTVVRLDNVSITFLSASGTTGNTYTVADATGSVQAFIRTTLGYTPPSSAASITGYVSQFNATPQLTIRSASDVVGGGTPPPPVSGAISLTTSPVLIDFNNLGSGLPTGVYVKQESTSTALGNDATVFGGSLASKTAWNNVSAGVKNFASATGLTATSDQTAQDASTNRALGFRQTGTAPTGGDPGVAFAFKIANTSGKSNLKLDFLLQSLDNSIGRTTTWTVDYGIGDTPTTFTTVTTSPATLTTAGTFASTPVTVNFPAALNNQSGTIWVRIVALTATTGSGSRPSTAVDDVKFSWN